MAKLHCLSEFKSSSSTEFEWDIRKVSDLTDVEILYSPVFYSENGNAWRLQLVKSVSRIYSITWTISAISVKCNNRPLKVSYNLYFPSKESIPSERTIVTIRNDGDIFATIARADVLDDLTVKFEIDELEIVHTESSSKMNNLSSPHHHCIGKMVFNQLASRDVTFLVKRCQFRAHKLILSATSPVFAAMFQTDTKEQQTNRVDIADIEPEVFEQFLYFIYTGEVDHLETMASDLLAAADKYDVQPLKHICMHHLLKNLSVENAAEMLVLTDRYSLGDFKSYVIGFIGRNKVRVIHTAGWNELIKSYPQLMAEFYEKS